jgi:pilus assembly protein Flp/PilA
VRNEANKGAATVLVCIFLSPYTASVAPCSPRVLSGQIWVAVGRKIGGLASKFGHRARLRLRDARIRTNSVVGVYHAVNGMRPDPRFRGHIKVSSIKLYNPRVRDRDTAPCSASPFQLEHAMKNLLKRFAKDESGATAIEYGLIAAGIALAIIAAVNSLGTALSSNFSSISSSLK